MRVAYVDTSCLVAIALSEPGYQKIENKLASFELLYSSNLLEAELRSTLSREGKSVRVQQVLRTVAWVYPERPLSGEIQRVLASGYVRGADTWHLSCALYLMSKLESLSFLTLDQKQLNSAASLGLTI